jgi:hypothetical protein
VLRCLLVIRIVIDVHRAEFPTKEFHIIFSGSLLLKKYWSTGCQLNSESNQREKPRKNEKNYKSGKYHIENALHNLIISVIKRN